MTDLDPKLNAWPTGAPLAGAKIHLVGIGGVAMTALAGLLIEAGALVSGSDRGLYPPMSDILKEMAVEVFEGYGPETLPPDCDLAVIGNVVTRAFPVLESIKRQATPYLSLPQALGRFFLAESDNLVVAGCHGKTTTTAMCAKLWSLAGLNPGFLIGGASLDFPRPFARGGGGVFIIEGDEYDSAFFNKVPKFVHYRPKNVILTSVEFDHADIYPDLKAVMEAFRSLVRLIPADGLLMANGDDPLVKELAAECKGRVEFYGLGDYNDWQVGGLSPEGFGQSFELSGPGGFYARLSLDRPGVYNALNAAAAGAAFVSLGGDGRLPFLALRQFKGVRRRQELLGRFGGITLIDDFAHHPTAVAKTLAGLRAAYPGQRLLAAFEPRSNTSRRAVFQHDYPPALAEADLVFLRRPVDPDKAPEGDRLNPERLAADLGPKAALFDDGRALGQAIIDQARAGDVVVVMTNGSFDGLAADLAESLARKEGAE